jgi:hypothetical protein
MALISALVSVLYYLFYCCFLQKVKIRHGNEKNMAFVTSSSPFKFYTMKNLGKTINISSNSEEKCVSVPQILPDNCKI